MAAIVSRMWSKKAVGEDASGNRTYTDAYHIVDANSRTEARTAPGLPARNDPMDEDPRYKRREITFAPYNGPTQWQALVTYGLPSNGSFPEPEDDPLLRPFRWTVQKSWVDRPNETDVNRRAKKNSAGDFFNPTPKKYRRRILIGTRYERFWDLAKSEKFENTCNANQISMGPLVIAPGEACCHSIEPAGEFEGDADYLLIEYAIEVATDERARDPAHPNDPATTSGFPFDSHQLDIGNFGWYTGSDGKPKRGRFCYATGTTAANSGNKVDSDADDVQLDGTGKPAARPSTEAQIYVRSFNLDGPVEIFTPIANPKSAEWLAGGTYPAGQAPTTSPFSTPTNPMWLFQDYTRLDWTDLFTLSAPPNPL